uniref:Uncharacterized protein n=1 Tax=Salix viminalis TaxID=40686 RepID=A0A6N2M6G2_SALVM
MKTMAELRREHNLPIPVNKDSLYKPIERTLKKFNPLVIPKSLQATLPFESKPKDIPKGRPTLERRRAVVMEPDERKVHALVQQLRLITNDKMKKRKVKKEQERKKLEAEKAKDEELSRKRKREERRERYRVQEKMKKKSRSMLILEQSCFDFHGLSIPRALKIRSQTLVAKAAEALSWRMLQQVDVMGISSVVLVVFEYMRKSGQSSFPPHILVRPIHPSPLLLTQTSLSNSPSMN